MLRRHRPRDARARGGGGVKQRQRDRAQIGESALQTGEQRLRGIVGRRGGRERQPGLPSPPRQRHLGNHERGRGEPGPVRCAATVGGEGEPADGHEPGPARPLRRIDHGTGDEIAPRGRHGREAVCAARLERAGRADGGKREAVTIGLLEAEPAFARAARRADDRRRIDFLAHAHGECRQARSAGGAGAADGRFQAAQQARALGV